MTFINTFLVAVNALLTLLFSIFALLGILLSFIFALCDFVINFMPRFLIPWFYLFMAIRLFKFISKRHNSEARG